MPNPFGDEPVNNSNPFGDSPAAGVRQQVQESTSLATSPGTRTPTTVGQKLIGAGELALTLGSGALIEPVAGIAGILQGIESFVRGDEDPFGRAADQVGRMQEMFTYRPRTAGGEESLQAVSRPAGAMARGIDRTGQKVSDITGSPTAGATTRTALEFFPGIFGFNLNRFNAGLDARALGSEIERRTGVNMGASARTQGRQISESVQQQTGGRTSQGEGFEQLQQAVQNARRVTKKAVNDLYTEARQTKAGVRVDQLVNFRDTVGRALSGFDVQDMSTVRRRLNEMEALNDLPQDSALRLNFVSEFRRRVSQNPGSSDAERAANGIIKAQLDEFLDAQFNADMITGDPSAIAKWEKARSANAAYAKNFKDDRTIRQLAEQDANAIEMSNWILGAASVAKPQAANTVRRLKNILGEESAEFQAIQQEVVFRIAEPLLRENPDLNGFRNNYDRWIRKNTPIMRELFGEGYSDLQALRDLSQGVRNATSPSFQANIDSTIARLTAGNQLSRNATLVGLITQGIGFIRQLPSPGRRRQIITQITGIDPSTSVFQRTPLAVIGGTQTLMNQQRGQTPVGGGQQPQPVVQGQRPAGSSFSPDDLPVVPR